MTSGSRELAAWATPAGRRPIARQLAEVRADLGAVAAGWRADRERLLPRGAQAQPAPSPHPFSTSWARRPTAVAVREVLQTGPLRALVRGRLDLDVHGRAELARLRGPAVIVANHGSALDPVVVVDALPAGWRRRTAVLTGPDASRTWWRSGGSALALNAVPVGRDGDPLQLAELVELLAARWNLLVFAEGGRSDDGHLGAFHPAAAVLAAAASVPVIPVGLRGTFAALPGGRRRPAPGRPRVAVRFGLPMRPRPGEDPVELTARVRSEVQRLVTEDATTWWRSEREPRPVPVPAARWRRIWEQSEEPTAGGRPHRTRIWRT